MYVDKIKYRCKKYLFLDFFERWEMVSSTSSSLLGVLSLLNLYHSPEPGLHLNRNFIFNPTLLFHSGNEKKQKLLLILFIILLIRNFHGKNYIHSYWKFYLWVYYYWLFCQFEIVTGKIIFILIKNSNSQLKIFIDNLLKDIWNTVQSALDIA